MSQPIPKWAMRAARRIPLLTPLLQKVYAGYFAAEMDKTGLVEALIEHGHGKLCKQVIIALARATEVEDE